MDNKGASPLLGRRVLLAEDDYFIAEEMSRTFRAEGVDVAGPVASVAEARKIVESEDAVDGAVLDINLQGEPVFPVADLLRQRGIPFVFATGYDRSVIPARYGDTVWCEKPVSPATLALALFRSQGK